MDFGYITYYIDIIIRVMAYRSFLKLPIIPVVAILISTAASAAENNIPHADNDDSYKLPLFIPKVAQAKTDKVMFGHENAENDEIYSLPKRAALKPSNISPAAGTGEADAQKKAYNKQYEEYQQQMKLYNEQMAEYKKQLAIQQQLQSQAPGDNDSTYVLPGQYQPAKKNVKPKPTAPKPQVAPVSAPAQVTAPQQTQPAAPAPAQPRYQAPAAQYNQKYNYSDEARPAHNADNYPNYYQ